jgi:hypothetical protein
MNALRIDRATERDVSVASMSVAEGRAECQAGYWEVRTVKGRKRRAPLL